jgi:hypothetical protein
MTETAANPSAFGNCAFCGFTHYGPCGAYVQALSELDPDVLVQSCGVGHVAVWFNVPDDFEGECGEYPAAAIREHLAELGFLRVVVAARNQGGGLCSFSP